MDQARLFIAIGISFFIFFLWSQFFAPPIPKVDPEAVKENSQSAPAQVQATDSASETEAKPSPSAPVTSSSQTKTTRKARKITVDTALFRMVLSEKGGTVVGLKLKNYRETMESDSPLKELINKGTKGGSVFCSLSGNSGPRLEHAIFTADVEGDTLNITGETSQIRFQYRTPAGLLVEKTYQFSPNSYLVDVSVTLSNDSAQAYQGSLGLGLQNSLDKGAGGIAFEGPSGLIDHSLQQVSVKDIEDQNKYSGKIGWIAIEDRYFMMSILPDKDFTGHMSLEYQDNNLKNQLVKDVSGLDPQQKETMDVKLFVGPKSLKILRSMNNGLDTAIDFGMFDFLAKPCLWFMNFIHDYIPNYGIAIIILTIISRAIFWPLAKKSYQSMGEMRKIQPLMQEIREKYKDDKARMNQEMMTLYKTYKVNPVGGCLPMLIQMPVFFALYRMLYSAIELRHAPFFGWINDLSAPDRLGNFDFKVPLLDAPTGIPVLTLLMSASMLLQQKMMPSPGDPAQAKMMMFMPVIMFFIFLNFSSGLVLYWFVSNIFSIVQQYYTQKMTA